MALVDNAIYIDGKRAVVPESLGQTVEELHRCRESDAQAFCWIGLLRPTPAEVQAVADEFSLHALAVEDTINAHQRPKVETYGDVDFVVLRPARYVDDTEAVEVGEISMFLGPNFVITVRHAAEPDLGEVRRRLEGDPELLAHGPVAVLYAVLDQIVDEYGPVLDGLQTDIDEIEIQVFGGDPGVSKRIYTLSREVIEFQRAVGPLDDMLAGLRYQLKMSAQPSDLELRRLLRDVADHATRVLERTEGFRQLLANILTVNAALVGQRQNEEMARLTQAGFDQNEQMKRISSWAAILFAPTLVAAIYGMNFTHMPELAWPLGYPMAIGLMLALAVVLWLLFKRRGWL